MPPAVCSLLIMPSVTQHVLIISIHMLRTPLFGFLPGFLAILPSRIPSNVYRVSISPGLIPCPNSILVTAYACIASAATFSLFVFLSPYGIIFDYLRSLFHFLLGSQRSCFEILFNILIVSSSFPGPCVVYHSAHVRATPSTAEQFHLFILNLSLSLCQNALYIGHRNGSLLTWCPPSFRYHMNLLLGIFTLV